MLHKNSKYYWQCQVLGWGTMGLSMLFFGYIYGQKINVQFVMRVMVVVMVGIISTHVFRAFIKKAGWMLLPVEKVIPRLIIGAIATSILTGILIIVFNEIFNLAENKLRFDFFTRLLNNSVNAGIFIIPWIMIYYFYHYIEKSRKQQLDTLKLEALVKELELKTIKAHINPHFIFNALNSIRALVDENPNRARTAITELSNILRSSMQAEKLETVSFEKELNIVKDYLALEYIRFEDRLRVEYEIDEDTLDQPVPPMMLQTLVENAIKHGISKQMNGGVVKVISDFKGNFHELVVQNTGTLNGQRNLDGFGLTSTQNRLQLMFGEKANFSINQLNGNMVEARVNIPASFHN